MSFNILVCENGCGSPTYGHVKSTWIFESNRFELRVIAMGCGCIQSKEYSDHLMNGKIKEPIYTGVDWVYPEDDNYQEAVHYLEHEKLIEIVGLPRKEIKNIPARHYN